MSKPDLEIIVPTRNRPEILARSLHRTRAHFPNVKIMVHDDASSDAGAVADAVAGVSNTELLRSLMRTGPAGARRKLISASRARWCLALDDDCYPRQDFDPSRWVKTEPAAGGPIVIGFRYYRSYDGDVTPAPNGAAGPCRCALGGASLLHRESILAIGSYRDFLVFAAEDTELALRVWASGSQVWCDPDNYIVHDHVPAGRDLQEEAFYYVRNRILVNILTLPLWYGLPLGIAQALRRVAVQDYKLRGLGGLAAGLIASVRHFKERRPMTVSQYRWLNTLPA